MIARREIFVTVAVCVALAGSDQFARGNAAPVEPRQSATAAPPPSSYRAVLDTYCVTCHSTRLRTAGIALDTLDLGEVASHGAVWEKVIRKLRTGEMPPAGQPRPDQATYEALSSWLEDTLDTRARNEPTPGKPALHRLNRTEYANAIRDLLDLEVDVTAFLPQDDSTHGFDNVADTLGVSPVLLEQYVAAARKISRVAVGRSTLTPSTEIYRAAPDLRQDDRLEGFPFGTRGGMLVRHQFPVDAEYHIRVKLARNVNEVVIGLQEEDETEITLDGARLLAATVGGGKYAELGGLAAANAAITADADDALQVRLRVPAGPHEIGAVFLRKTSALGEGGFGGVPQIASVAISGPFDAADALGGPLPDTPSRERIFVCRPSAPADEHRCARTILATLARRAYRRPVTDADTAILLDFFDRGRAAGDFDAGIELGLRRILADPQFVFRFEPDNNDGAAHPVTDLELASRLSFFLWSSLPDDELLDLAAADRLRDATVLGGQVRRMLADPRAEALVSNFAGQWLYLRNLRGTTPNPRLFPDFDDNLRQAFRRETELLFNSLIREDRSVLDLLDADYTFLNERLARHYGVPGVVGAHFRRVAVTDPRRRGLLGHGSILTVTSYPTRTSPVLRGKWILENLLASPPPPPPPDVPELPDQDPDAVVRSMRERMAAHRANPVCAGCHSKLDPLGLSLEHFDTIGRWREADVGAAIDAAGALHVTETRATIDASGALPSGEPFDGPEGLRRALLGQPALFVRAMTEKLLVYALGRGVEYYDFPAIRAIERDAARHDYRFGAIVMGIVTSTPFQMKQAPERPRVEAARSPGGNDTSREAR